ncbi:Citron Rho-interacting kinase, partial [Caligus rogercresseyi]
MRKTPDARRNPFDFMSSFLSLDLKILICPLWDMISRKNENPFQRKRTGSRGFKGTSRIEALSQEREDLSKKLRDRKEALKSENEAEKVKKEMNLMKVDLRIANKQVTEHKETISYLRQSYRDERDSARKLQEKLLDVKAREESLASEVESLKRSLCSAQEDKEAMSKLKDELASKSSELKILGFKLSNAEFESERSGSRLEKAEKEVIKYRESQTQLNIYKAACLELENQAKEFETVIEKLEEKNEKLSGELSQSKASSQESEAKGTALKIEINDLKSKLIFAQSQLKESQSKVGEMEGIYKAEEGKLRERLEDLTKSRDAHLGTINDLRLQMEDLLGKFSTLSGEDSTQKVALKDLKESYSSLLTRYHELLEGSNSLTSQNEELRIRLARSEDDIAEGKDELSKVVRSHATVQHELLTKINQLEKLIDYLQSKLNKRAKCRSVFSSHAKCSSDKENMALPYEALKEKLKEEEGKNVGLLKELNSLRGELRCSRTNPTTFLLPSNDQRANHSIPHRWTSQTNMKVTKCSTCFGFVHFCRQASVCQHCHRTVHSHCAPKSQDDCGLPKTLAPVLKSSSSGSGKKPFEGYLKIPEQGGKYWMSVHVRIHDDRLILKGEGMETREINLMPSNGFVYIQSSVVYTELLHTTAYDQPHVFKIGYSNAKDTHYFMAKSFTDKALWIKEIENISLRMKYEAALLSEDSEDEEEDDELADNRVLAALDPSYNVYCVAPMKDSWLLGRLRDSSFINKIVLITGQSRKLGVLNMDRIHSRDFNPVNLSAVKSCHLFGLGVTEGLVYLCAVDDCRVSIFKYEGSAFQLVHKFSTDNPTSCLQFTASSVLVITDKIYDIDLEDFAVEEFLDLDESPMTLSNNYPIAMFQINPKEFLLCFQERGLFVNSSGNKSRPDIKWNSISGQFAYSKGKLWVTYYNAVE